jgi:phosphohistidine phosphatase
MHEDVMLVGHMPHMSRLASLLLTGDPSPGPVHFRNAGIVCLVRDPGGHWGIEWVITPYLLSGKA